MTRLVFLVLSLCVFASLAADTPTRLLREVFIGRCAQLTPECDCLGLWDVFYNITAYKSSQDVTAVDYEPLLAASAKCWASQQHKSLFWSGSGGISHDLSRRCDRYCTLEDTLPAYCLNGLHWCGANAAQRPGFNTTECPTPIWNSQTRHWENAEWSFWEAASVHFAREARGNITILLGSLRGQLSYNLNSTFATFEVPNLQANQIDSVSILVIKNNTMKPPEKCGSGSLVKLMEDLRQSLGNEKPIDCIDDSIHITYLLCAADPYSPQCSFAAQNDNDPPFFSLFELIMLTISGFVFGMLASFVIVIFCRSRQAARELDEKPDGYMVVSMPSEADELLE